MPQPGFVPVFEEVDQPLHGFGIEKGAPALVEGQGCFLAG